MANTKRHTSEAHARKLWKQLRSIPKVARRIGYSDTGTARLLYRFGIVDTKTGRSK